MQFVRASLTMQLPGLSYRGINFFARIIRIRIRRISYRGKQFFTRIRRIRRRGTNSDFSARQFRTLAMSFVHTEDSVTFTNAQELQVSLHKGSRVLLRGDVRCVIH